jgi:hypothetical protein
MVHTALARAVSGPALIAAAAVGLAAPSLIAAEPSEDELVAELTGAVRAMIEPQFRANVGIGFSSFVCRIGSDIGPGGRFDCDAVDEEGDRIRYTLEIDEEGTATIVLAAQPAEDLSAEDLAVLEPPCRLFLALYGAADWDTLIAGLHPALLEAMPPDRIRAQLESVRSSLGELRSADLESYARHVSDRHEMEYALDCERGPGVARFGLAIDDEGARVTAFVITPAPGSPIHTELMLAEGRSVLTDLIGEPVSRIDLRLDQLHDVGDAVEGTAWLPDGRDLPVRAVQHGRTDDFDVIDYTYQMLDVEWMLHRAFASRPGGVTSVDCPTRIAPEDGTVECRVVLGSGETLAVTVARHGGDHRIVSSAPVD